MLESQYYDKNDKPVKDRYSSNTGKRVESQRIDAFGMDVRICYNENTGKISDTLSDFNEIRKQYRYDI